MLHWNLHNWPEWKHQFQLFLATLDHLEDSQKLTLLCYSLGPDGLAIACKLFPELANRNPTASKSVAFATVWWQFNEHCWARYSPQIDPLKDLQEERNKLKQICDEAMGKAEYHILHKFIPILSLCELELVCQRVPPLEHIVQNFIDLFGVQIEPCCLKNHPIGVNETIYTKHGRKLSSLTLKSLPEEDTHKVFPFFRQIKCFSMVDMKIFEDIGGFPTDLVELTLIDCKIEEELVFSWLSTFNTTLKRLHMENYEESFYFNPLACNDYLVLDIFENLNSLTFKNNYTWINIDAYKLEFLILISHGQGNDKPHLTTPNLKHLYFDYPSTGRVCFVDQTPSLKCLTVKNLTCLRRLSFESSTFEELDIISTVNPKYKSQIDSQVINVIVEYWDIPAPPIEPNLIFEMLNYDCLLEIIKHLSQRDWMEFGRLHENAEMVVATYKYPRVIVSSKDLINSGLYSRDRDHFNRVTNLVRRLRIDQKTTRTFRSKNVSVDLFDILPSGLDELIVCDAILDDPKSAAYMKRLNPTLRCLKITDWERYRKSDEKQSQWLAELENLEKISIATPLPQNILPIIVVQSWHSLESLQMTFNLGEDGWTGYEDALKLISTLRNLRELAIERKTWKTPTEDDNNLVADMIKSIGAKLNKLKLSGFDGEDLKEILSSDSLQNLLGLELELELEIYWDIETSTSCLCSLTKLRTLRVELTDPDPDLEYDETTRLDLQSWFMPLISLLPELREFNTTFNKCTFKYETELRQYLKRTNRQLSINSRKL